MAENKHPESVYNPPIGERELVRTGLVTECSTASYTADVKLVNEEMLCGIPILGSQGAPHARDTSWLLSLRGSYVALLRVGTSYVILGSVPNITTVAGTDQVNPALEPGYGGEEVDTYGKEVYRNAREGRPKDFLQGDKILRTSGGALLGLFREGAVTLQASPLCKILMGRFKDFFRIVSRRIQVFSDFGEMRIEQTSSGRVSASLHGGADYKEETHPTVTKWTVQAWVGDDPANSDNRLHIRINDVDNAEFVTLKMDIKGDMYLETSKTRNATHGKDENIEVKENRTLTIGQSQTESIGEDLTTDIGGSRTETVGSEYTQSVGGSYTQSVAGSGNISTGDDLTIIATGDLTIQSSGKTTIN